jgi:hypothetical protein
MVAIAAGVVGVLIALSFTPPGRVVAGEVGELVGIGEESTVQHAGNEANSLVVASGEAPGGVPYEIAAFTKFRVKHGEQPGDAEVIEGDFDGELCIDMDLPGGPQEDEGVGACFTSENLWEDVERETFMGNLSFAPPPLQPETELIVAGHASRAVDSVEVTYELEGEVESAQVELAQVSQEQADAIGSPRPGSAFFAFISGEVLQEDPAKPGVLTSAEIQRAASTIRITAYDSSGDVLRSGGLRDSWNAVPLLDHLPLRFSNTPTRDEILKDCFDRLRESVGSGETSEVERPSCDFEPTKP